MQSWEAAQKEGLLQRTEKTYVLTPEASGLEFEKPRIVTMLLKE
ncbi:hypothetical protein [Candidatus Methanoperedens nitratireducens]|uniref:Uncharacterized protein n=1 Tax=Candidatus Methanoperedens nitratireducens TaxID=1392998 RepID=A0A284VP74_9EURY|nr:hypothetical protein [Candidatus Methanoperedens nitroreducens]SNQ61074.1 hypothetical protein MNV_2290015 [Candidatus Methanoperedens nitroreducens]